MSVHCFAEMPTRDVLDTALQWQPTARPVPNLGYACLTMALREQKPPIFTNRCAAQHAVLVLARGYLSSSSTYAIFTRHEHRACFDVNCIDSTKAAVQRTLELQCLKLHDTKSVQPVHSFWHLRIMLQGHEAGHFQAEGLAICQPAGTGKRAGPEGHHSVES